jgi:Ca2+-binding EF-hand superfamily protein
LPKIADFGNPESPEVQKISFYEVKFNEMFTELTSMWDWYDKNADGTIETGEKMIRFQSTRRTRGRRNIVKVS